MHDETEIPIAGDVVRVTGLGRCVVTSIAGEPGRIVATVQEVSSAERRVLQGEETETGRLVLAIWGRQGTRTFARAVGVSPKTAATWVRGDVPTPDDVTGWLKEQAAAGGEAYEDARELAADILDDEDDIDASVLAGVYRKVADELDKFERESDIESSDDGATPADSARR